MPSYEAEIVGYFQQAVESEVGIAVEVLTDDDARKLRQKLYTVQREHPEYSGLGFIIKETAVWIVKKEETVSDPFANN